MLQVVSKYKFLLLSLSLFHAVSATAECGTATDTSVEAVVRNVKSLCCGRATSARQNSCINASTKAITKASGLLDAEFRGAAAEALQQLKESACALIPEAAAECTEGTLHAVSEAVNRARTSACTLKMNAARQAKLQSLMRLNRGTRKQLGGRYNAKLHSELKELLRSKNCGAGGQRPKTGCKWIQSASDGGGGNVYKLSDYSPHYPVFITHNGAGYGSAITSSGQHIDTPRYTGMGNPDARGPRHHYRFNRPCGSFPSGFLIKLGSTCYRIDSPCSRVE